MTAHATTNATTHVTTGASTHVPTHSGALPALPELDRRRAETLPAAILLVALSALAPLSVDMFLPSLPTMTQEFGAVPSTMQLAVLLFILAFASSQLVYGPLSDRAGRRPALFAGLTLFIVGGAVCLTARTPSMLIAGRVLQGLGGGAGPALAQAMVLDVYGRDRAARVLAYMAIALPLAPAIAPIIGGFLHDFSGWHSVFLTLISLGAVLAIMYNLLLPETNPAERRAARARTGVLSDYLTALSSTTFMAYALVMGLMFGGQLLFISTSAFVLIEELGLTASMYGFSFALVAAGIMSGAALSSRLVVRLTPRYTVLLGAGVATLAGGVMAALAWLASPSIPSVLGPMFFVGVGLGVTRPSATAAALIEFPQMAGLASGLLGFSQMLVASLLNIGYGRFFQPSALALASGVALAMLAGLITVLVLRPGRARSPAGPPESDARAADAGLATPDGTAAAGEPPPPDTSESHPRVEAPAPAADAPPVAGAPIDVVAARLEAVRLATPVVPPVDSPRGPEVAPPATEVLQSEPAPAPSPPTEGPEPPPVLDAPVIEDQALEASHVLPAPGRRALGLQTSVDPKPVRPRPGRARRRRVTTPPSPSAPPSTDRLTRPAAALLLTAVGILLSVRALLRLGRTRRIARD